MRSITIVWVTLNCKKKMNLKVCSKFKGQHIGLSFIRIWRKIKVLRRVQAQSTYVGNFSYIPTFSYWRLAGGLYRTFEDTTWHANYPLSLLASLPLLLTGFVHEKPIPQLATRKTIWPPLGQICFYLINEILQAKLWKKYSSINSLDK